MKRSLYSMFAVIAFSAVSITAFAQSNTKSVETTVYGDGTYRTESVQYNRDYQPINRWDKTGYFGNRYHIGIYDPTRQDYNEYSGEYEGNVSNINNMRYDYYQNLNDHNYNTIRYNDSRYNQSTYNNNRYDNTYNNNRYNTDTYNNRYYNERYDSNRYGNTRYNDRQQLDRYDNRSYDQRRIDNRYDNNTYERRMENERRQQRINYDNRTQRMIDNDLRSDRYDRYDDRLNIPVNTWR